MEVASYPRCWNRRAAVRKISCRESTTASRGIGGHGKQKPHFSQKTREIGQLFYLSSRYYVMVTRRTAGSPQNASSPPHRPGRRDGRPCGNGGRRDLVHSFREQIGRASCR